MLGQNIALNFFGRGTTAILTLVSVPFVISFLGIEAYGLIGFFATFTALASLFDLGLTVTANRELARLSAQPGNDKQICDLVRTLEIACLCGALFVGVIATLSADYIAYNWLQNSEIDSKTILESLYLMIFAIVLQIVINFYSGCLLGLHRFATINILNVLFSFLQIVGALLLLWLLEPSLRVFFLWHSFARILHVVSLILVVWRVLPGPLLRARFSIDELRNVWRFAAGIAATSIMGLLATQTDNLVLSRLLTLEQFGYYTISRTAALGLLLFAIPIHQAIFPHFSRLISVGDDGALSSSYHLITQLMACLVFPCSLTLILFSEEILWAWTGNLSTREHAAAALSVLALGAGLSAMMHVPHALRIAAGWVRFLLVDNTLYFACLLPMVAILAWRNGTEGAAIAWTTVQIGAFFLAQPIMHKWILKKQLLTWYVKDCFYPAMASATVVISAYLILPAMDDRVNILVAVSVTVLLSIAAATIACPPLRREAAAYLAKLHGRFLPRA